jgi:hypothetical protein
MHFNFNFSARQVLWTLDFAAQMILLVVLLGRDRARRYPWFTAGVVLVTLRLMAEELLAGRTAQLLYKEILLVLGDVAVVVGLLVLVEVARRAFAGARRPMWIVNTLGLLVLAGIALAFWGPWPAAKDLALDTLLGKLKLMQLVAVKGELLGAVLAVELGLLVVILGRRFKGGWRSYPQQIIIGLSTVAIAALTAGLGVQSIVNGAHPHSQEEYNHILDLLARLMNANQVVYVAASVWWIVWLWLDEPGTEQTPVEAVGTAEEPEAAGE